MNIKTSLLPLAALTILTLVMSGCAGATEGPAEEETENAPQPGVPVVAAGSARPTAVYWNTGDGDRGPSNTGGLPHTFYPKESCTSPPCNSTGFY